VQKSCIRRQPRPGPPPAAGQRGRVHAEARSGCRPRPCQAQFQGQPRPCRSMPRLLRRPGDTSGPALASIQGPGHAVGVPGLSGRRKRHWFRVAAGRRNAGRDRARSPPDRLLRARPCFLAGVGSEQSRLPGPRANEDGGALGGRPLAGGLAIAKVGGPCSGGPFWAHVRPSCAAGCPPAYVC